MGNYYVEIECSLRSQWMDNDFIERCIFLLSLSIITSDFEIALIAKGVAWENLSSLVLCIHLACLLLAAITLCFALSFVAHRRHVALIALTES